MIQNATLARPPPIHQGATPYQWGSITTLTQENYVSLAGLTASSSSN